MRWTVLFLALMGFLAQPALACSGDKDDDKDSLQTLETKDITAVHKCSDKEKDKDKDRDTY